MSNIIRHIVTKDNQLIEVEFEKKAFVKYRNEMRIFNVPENNLIKTKFGIFKWNEHQAHVYGKFLICCFNAQDTMMAFPNVKQVAVSLKGITHD